MRSATFFIAATICALQPIPSPAAVNAVGSVNIVVSDLDRATQFYSDLLTFRKLGEEEIAGAEAERLLGLFGVRARVATLQLGSETVRLLQFLAPEGRPLPVDSRSNDAWFQHIAIVVSDMGQAYATLRARQVRHASSGPQRLPDWNKNAGGIEAFYFKDPDGHVLEVIHFPSGKGDPRWQIADGKLFLGIDHTAIAVTDTERSLRFYQGTLGMRVAGASENYGTEQEHLNNVFGARLRITALRAAHGPGLELLEYLAPRDGRPYPESSRSNDLWQWQTQLGVTDADADASAVQRLGASWISPGAVTLTSPLLGVRRGALVRDPDGHALLLTTP